METGGVYQYLSLQNHYYPQKFCQVLRAFLIFEIMSRFSRYNTVSH